MRVSLCSGAGSPVHACNTAQQRAEQIKMATLLRFFTSFPLLSSPPRACAAMVEALGLTGCYLEEPEVRPGRRVLNQEMLCDPLLA